MNSNEGRVYFALDGDDFDPEEITLLLGIEPTSIMRKSSSDKHCSSCKWELSTPNLVNEYIDVFKMSESIVSLLLPKKKLLLQALKNFDITPRLEVVLWISVNENHSTPAIGFEKETLQFLSEIGAFIDIDTYKH